MRPARRHLAVLLPVTCLVAVLGGGADCNSFGQCECTPCQSAIVLNVFDEDNQPLADWVVDATLNGAPVDVTNCDETLRVAPGTCSFGFETGVYRISIQAPGFQTRQLAARFAAKSGEDCCSTCLPVGTTVNAVLERE